MVIYNAGAGNTTRRVTADGIEATLAVNHLAPFLLTILLAPLMQATPSSRVVTVSSYMHTRVKSIPWDDLQAGHDSSAAATYNLTKLLNVLFTNELARRWAGTSVTANALHPGWPLKTNLGREQTGPGAVFDRATKLIGSSAAKGARTSFLPRRLTRRRRHYRPVLLPLPACEVLGPVPQHRRRRTPVGTQRGTLRSCGVVGGIADRHSSAKSRSGILGEWQSHFRRTTMSDWSNS